MGKKVFIIGAGVSGLTAGIYAQLNGFESEIYELHSIPGGECTGWQRGDYHIDGCIHWLVGTKPGPGLHQVWRQVGALDDATQIVNHDIFSVIRLDGRELKLYTDARQLEEELLRLSPQDAKEIKWLCRAIRGLGCLTMPTKRPFHRMGLSDGLAYLPMLPHLKTISQLGKITVTQYAARFQDPLIRFALEGLMPAEYSAVSLVATLASLHLRDGGYPLGGSLAMAKRMEARYLSLGGKVHYRSPVARVLVQDHKATGIALENGQEMAGDFIISSADSYETLYRLLGGTYLPDRYRQRYENPAGYPVYTTSLVAFGVDAPLDNSYHTVMVRPQNPVDGGGLLNDTIGFSHYGYDPSMAPQGKSIVQCILGSNYEYWQAKTGDPAVYRAEKQRLARDVLAELEKVWPQVQGKVEMTDVATPVTYHRYCRAHRGSWMSWMSTPENGSDYFPGALPGLEGFLMTGQWTLPPGGLPPAVATGKFTIYNLCELLGQKFIGEA